MSDIKERLVDLLGYFEECGWTSRAQVIRDAFDEIDRLPARLDELESGQEPLLCDVCGSEASDPWHFSTPSSKHNHACDNCWTSMQSAPQPEPVVPEGYALIPLDPRYTARPKANVTNEMKAENISQYVFTRDTTDEDENDADEEIMVPWTVIKEIYQGMAKTAMLTAAPPAGRSEGEVKAEALESLDAELGQSGIGSLSLFLGYEEIVATVQGMLKRRAERLRGNGEGS